MITIIGQMIAQLREENSMSIEELAQKSGVPAEKIKLFESAKEVPSVIYILKLGRVLGSRITGFEAAEQFLGGHVSQKDQVLINRSDKGEGCQDDQIHSVRYLHHLENDEDTHIEPIMIKLASNDTPYDMSLHCGDGELFLFVVDGDIEIVYPDDNESNSHQVYSLSSGDSAVYSAEKVHSIKNISQNNGNAKVLLVGSRRI